MPKSRITFIAIFLSVLLLLPRESHSADSEDYRQALESVRSGDISFAFMNFRSIVEYYPGSKYRERSLFALGEYYYRVSDFRDAAKTFSAFLAEYPDSKMKPFALFYCYKTAKLLNDTSYSGMIKEHLLDWERIILVFKKSKKHSLKSPLGVNYNIIHYVDRLEFFIDGKLQERIDY